MSFHNTLGLQGREHLLAIQQAKSQEEKIKYLFISQYFVISTPTEIHNHLTSLGFNYPITSVRRAITNLTNHYPYILEKTLLQRPGGLGKPNYCWRLNKHRK